MDLRLMRWKLKQLGGRSLWKNMSNINKNKTEGLGKASASKEPQGSPFPASLFWQQGRWVSVSSALKDEEAEAHWEVTQIALGPLPSKWSQEASRPSCHTVIREKKVFIVSETWPSFGKFVKIDGFQREMRKEMISLFLCYLVLKPALQWLYIQ